MIQRLWHFVRSAWLGLIFLPAFILWVFAVIFDREKRPDLHERYLRPAAFYVLLSYLAIGAILWLGSALRDSFRHSRISLASYRIAKGLCPACGYDLRASKDRCPECGRAIDPEG